MCGPMPADRPIYTRLMSPPGTAVQLANGHQLRVELNSNMSNKARKKAMMKGFVS